MIEIEKLPQEFWGNLALAAEVGEFLVEVVPSSRGWMVTSKRWEDGASSTVEVVRQTEAVAAMKAIKAADDDKWAAWAVSAEKAALDRQQAEINNLPDVETTDVCGGSWSKQD